MNVVSKWTAPVSKPKTPRYNSRPNVHVVRPGSSTIVLKVLTIGRGVKDRPACRLYVGGVNGGFLSACGCKGAHANREQAIDCVAARERVASLIGDLEPLARLRAQSDRILTEDMNVVFEKPKPTSVPIGKSKRAKL